jgi:hypothetical protein
LICRGVRRGSLRVGSSFSFAQVASLSAYRAGDLIAYGQAGIANGAVVIFDALFKLGARIDRAA